MERKSVWRGKGENQKAHISCDEVVTHSASRITANPSLSSSVAAGMRAMSKVTRGFA